jgi:hypothetical protein
MIIDAISSSNEVVRQALYESDVAKISYKSDLIDQAVPYFERQLDHYLVRKAFKQRFSIGIKPASDASSDSADIGASLGYETYAKGAVGEMVDQGMLEGLTAGVGGKISRALGNLFISETQVWGYTSDGETTDQSIEAESLINLHRKNGGFWTAAVKADQLSCAINGSLLYIDIRGKYLKYHVVSPSCFHAIFHSTISDSGIDRAVDYSEIEDATAVVLRLSDRVSSDVTKQQYLAIFGRSEDYPNGRYVTYHATRWDGIPDVGDREAHDCTLPDGTVANPLSYLAAQNPTESIPEYPIVAFDGGLTLVTNEIVSTSSSLYENCIEIDIAYSRLLKDALNAARGKDIISNPSGAPLPRTTEGVVSLLRDQTLDIKGQPASNAQGAMSVLESAIVSIGHGYNVPGYMIVSGPATLTDTSGVALMIRTAPLVEFRRHRVALNSLSVDKIYDIERGMLRIFTGSADFLKDIKQTWDAGKYIIPEDSMIKTERLAKAEESGYIDYVEAVKQYHNLATDEDGMATIDKYTERAEEYPGKTGGQNQPVARNAQPVGLTFGR